MTGKLSELELVDEYHGSGALTRGKFELLVPVFQLIRDRYDNASPWEFRAHAPAGVEVGKLTELSEEPLTFEGRSEAGRKITLKNIHWSNIQAQRIRASVDSAEFDDDSLNWRPELQRITVQFTATPVAMDEYVGFDLSTTGEVVASGEPLPSWMIPTRLGRGRFVRQFVHEHLPALDGEPMLAMSWPTLVILVDPDCVSQRPSELVAVLEEDLHNFSRLLSLLSRQHVEWTHVRVDSRKSATLPFQRHVYEHHRRAVMSKISHNHDRLVLPGRMEPCDLGDMLERLQLSAYRRPILSSIAFLVESLGASSLEQRIVNAFTALETMVAGVAEADGKQFIITESRAMPYRVYC